MVRKKITLKIQITLYTSFIILLVLSLTYNLISKSIENDVIDKNGQRMLSIAHLVSTNPIVIEGLTGQRDEASIQEYALYVMKELNLTTLVVADLDIVRKSHADPTLIGERAITEYETLIRNREKTYVIDPVGPSGISLKAFFPIYDKEGKHIGVVATGLVLPEVELEIAERLKSLKFITLVGIAIGVMMSLMLARNIKKTLFNLEPFEIAQGLVERTMLLHSVRDGIISTDIHGNIMMLNKSAKEKLSKVRTTDSLKGMPITRLFNSLDFERLKRNNEVRYDMEYKVNDESFYVNQIPIIAQEVVTGYMFTFRYKEEIVTFAEELTGVKNYIEALRSQVHEFTNKLHVIFGLVQTKHYDDLETYMYELVHLKNQELYNITKKIQDPIISAFLLSKFDKSREQNVQLFLTDSTDFKARVPYSMAHDLVTIIGNLLENAFDSTQLSPIKTVAVELIYKNNQITISVWDSGMPIDEETMQHIFDSGFTTKEKGQGIGLHLVKKVIRRLEGTIVVENNQETGKEFTITIPFEAKEENFYD